MSSLKTESAFLENFDVRNYSRDTDRIPVRLISHGSGSAAKLHIPEPHSQTVSRAARSRFDVAAEIGS